MLAMLKAHTSAVSKEKQKNSHKQLEDMNIISVSSIGATVYKQTIGSCTFQPGPTK